MPLERRYRAGDTLEDVCRACKADRFHTVIVVDAAGRPLRVSCDYCHSEHNYRGGPALDTARGPASAARAPAPRVAPPADVLPLVSERERAGTSRPAKPDSAETTTGAPNVMTPDKHDELEMLLRRIIREEAGVTPVVPAAKWRDGTLVLRPGSPGLQEKTWPIETFFHKIVMVRNRLRTLEQQINASELPDDVKVKLQAYVTGCYGSLTSFNVLFADEADQFKGSGGE
jgi:hypothetical protein